MAIDYPRDGERVIAGHYAIRLTIDDAQSAQIRINGGAWCDCRESVGHFWHDWAAQAGEALIEVRTRRGKGRWSIGVGRSCAVEIV